MILYCPECHSVAPNLQTDSPRVCTKCKLPLQTRQEIKLWKMDASVVGQRIIARVLVAGESQQKAAYLKFAASCVDCGSSREVDLATSPELILRLVTRDARPVAIARAMLPKFEGKHEHRWILTQKGQALDYRVLKVRDIVELEDSADKSITARDYYTVLLNPKLPAEKKLLVDGTVLIHPKRNDLLLVVEDCAPLVSVAQGFSLTDNDFERLKPLQQLGYDGLKKLFDSTIAPEIVGRESAKLASAVCVFSVNWLPPLVEGQSPQPGCVRVWFIGDMRCGKGSILRWWKDSVGLGEHGFGEAASRAGLLYWVDPESSVIVWGLLVQADLGLAILEGMHGLPVEQVPEFREALAQQKVEVRKKATGVAWARARILADANSSKLIRECVFPCQALLHVRCLPDPADITRIDLAVPFSEDDVAFEQIQKSTDYAKRQGLDRELIAKLALWAWSRRTHQIKLTPGAVEKAKEVFGLMQKYKTGRIPLVHNGSFLQILRISTAFAVATFSSPNGEELVVEAKHVDLAWELLQELLELWDLSRVPDFLHLFVYGLVSYGFSLTLTSHQGIWMPST